MLASSIVSMAVVLMLLSGEMPAGSGGRFQAIDLTPGVSAHNVTSKDVSMIKASNFSWVRVNLWTSSDIPIRILSSNGLNVLGIIGNATMNLTDINQWRNEINDLTKRYDGIINAWEILNEPTVSFPIGSKSNLSPKQYFELSKSAYEIVKTNDPNAVVIGFGGIRVLDQNILDYSWVSGLVSLGILKYCDAVSAHLYSTTTNPLMISINFRAALSDLIQLVQGKDIWVTETGQPSDMNPTSFIGVVYPLLSELGIRHVFWYEFRDWVDDFGHHFGLLEKNFTPRPSYYYMKKMNDLIKKE